LIGCSTKRKNGRKRTVAVVCQLGEWHTSGKRKNVVVVVDGRQRR
jgi:hypothetical protein